jgi:hypothetical protein
VVARRGTIAHREPDGRRRLILPGAAHARRSPLHDPRPNRPDDSGPDPDDDDPCDCPACRDDDTPGDLIGAALIFLKSHVRPFGAAGPEIGRDDADGSIPDVVKDDLGNALASAARFLGRTFDQA